MTVPEMSIKELLRLADQENSLSCSERQALAAELRKRRPQIVVLSIAEAILGTAVASAQKIEREFYANASAPGRFSHPDFQDIVAEFSCLFLHLCYRDSFLYVNDSEQRVAFMHSIFRHMLLLGSTGQMTK
jgi:hypothetical protein